MADPPLTAAALTAAATHLAMAGEPAARAAQFAERALVGMAGPPRGRAWSEAVRVLVVTERYEVAGRELERVLDRGGVVEVADALALRAGLRMRIGDLPRALDLAHRCGATPLEEHALTELRAAGARPRRRLTSGAGALTPSERRIAELAAAGHRNREIADALYLTLATVEYHLRHCYRKLGIVSRSGLTAALESC
jgi:DNA-binding CsgD family transcriptional regulator